MLCSSRGLGFRSSWQYNGWSESELKKAQGSESATLGRSSLIGELKRKLADCLMLHLPQNTFWPGVSLSAWRSRVLSQERELQSQQFQPRNEVMRLFRLF